MAKSPTSTPRKSIKPLAQKQVRTVTKTATKKVAKTVVKNKAQHSAPLPVPRLRVMTIVGTRPELIRLSRIIAKLDQYCDHVLVHTGQNYDYELSGVFFKELGIRKPDVFLEAAGNTGVQTLSLIHI